MNESFKFIERRRTNWPAVYRIAFIAVLLISVAMLTPVLPTQQAHALNPARYAGRHTNRHAAQNQAQGNVVFNETFDGAFANDSIGQCAQGGCEVPQSWGVWFIPRRDTDPQGVNFQPQFGSTNAANRVRSGNAQRIFENNKTFTGGIYRKIDNARVGSKIRFTVWGMMWSTNDESVISARPSTGIRLRIGIDPLGGNNGTPSPLSSQVVWSQEQEVKDNYAQFTVETDVRSPTIIVYTYATMKDIVRHNEVFWDDAVLEYVDAPPAAPTTDPNATADPNATVAPTVEPTAAPAGEVRHTVVAGDTLYGIALQYDTTVDDIKSLNSLENDNLSIGQELIVKAAASASPANTPLPPTPDGSPAPPAPGTAVITGPISVTGNITETGQACMTAYFDDNGNGLYDGSVEDYVPNVEFTLMADNAVVGTYVSDGVNKHCFENLPPIEYTVMATTSLAYVATTPMNDTIDVSPGAQANFAVGLRNASDGGLNVSKTSTPAPNPFASTGNVFGILATIGGSLLVLGAVGIVASLFLRRRQL